MMTFPSLHTAMLKCHSETYSEAIQGIEARVCWRDGRWLAITYALTGDITGLRIPPLRPARSADRLWEHTCFEAFVGVTGKAEYYEFNFSPSGEWAVYAFRRYRESAPLAGEERVPEITVRSGENSLELDAIVRLDHLPLVQPRASLRLALSAVIEENSGMLSYWALEHPAGSPDFHHPDSFALEIEMPDVEAIDESALAKR
jgi:hypothetical protein